MELWTLQLLNGSRKSDCRNTNKAAATSNYEVIKWSVVHAILFPLQILPMLAAITPGSTYGALVAACIISAIAMVVQTVLFNNPKLTPCRAAMLTLNILAMSQMMLLS